MGYFSTKIKQSKYAPIIFVLFFVSLIGYLAEPISKLNPLIQFLFISIPITLVVLVYFGKRYDGLKFVLALISITWAWDLIQPPYMVSYNGIISTQAMFSATSVDFIIGSMFQAMGFSGTLLFYMTYIFAFAVLYAIAMQLSQN